MFHVKPKAITREIKECPVCGKNDFSLFLNTQDYFLTQEEFTIDKCLSCGFVFTNPIPIESELSKYYDSPDYLSHTANKTSLTGEIYKMFRSVNIKNKYKLVSSYTKGKSILDIGCGTGELLNFFKQKGWDVQGVEPNQSARAFASRRYNIDVFNENELDKFEENSFNVISMWHVLEHVPDLDDRMKQLNKLVKKDGLILIALPNLNSPDAVKYGKQWAGLDVPRHLYHFTKHTLQVLLKRHKMELIDSIPMKFDAYYVSLLSEKYLKHSLPFIPAFVNGLQSNLKARRDNNYSSMIFVIRPSK